MQATSESPRGSVTSGSAGVNALLAPQILWGTNLAPGMFPPGLGGQGGDNPRVCCRPAKVNLPNEIEESSNGADFRLSRHRYSAPFRPFWGPAAAKTAPMLPAVVSASPTGRLPPRARLDSAGAIVIDYPRSDCPLAGGFVVFAGG